MSLYILKPGVAAFRITDGPFAGREYFPGIIYSEQDAGVTHRPERFEPYEPDFPPKTEPDADDSYADEAIDIDPFVDDFQPEPVEDDDKETTE